ncbi:MAG: hypothetical protein IJ685_11330 [Selenomonadaceae bacterium]|nr:hypothetical protein [Selenomonadaceae bacterium]
MDIREIANPATSLAGTSAHRSKSSGIASEYSKILASKIANVKTDIEKMNATQEKLDEIADLQEEITGEVKIDEDSGNANRNDSSGTTTAKTVETIKRFMPDGSILITTYEGGSITEQIKQKPHLQIVADYSAPPNPDGSVATKIERTQSLDLAALLTM